MNILKVIRTINGDLEGLLGGVERLVLASEDLDLLLELLDLLHQALLGGTGLEFLERVEPEGHVEDHVLLRHLATGKIG